MMGNAPNCPAHHGLGEAQGALDAILQLTDHTLPLLLRHLGTRCLLLTTGTTLLQHLKQIRGSEYINKINKTGFSFIKKE
jgi:hypothetical protein